MNKWVAVLLLTSLANVAFGQNSWIFFQDKGASSHIDSAVYQPYLEDLADHGYEILGTSKWLNAAAVKGRIQAPLPFTYIKNVRWMQDYAVKQEMATEVQSEDTFTYGNLDVAIEMLNLHEYHRMGYTGKGVTLALFDAGFHNIDTLSAFDSLWLNNRVKSYYDFVDNDTNIFDEGGHGTAVLSLAGVSYPDSFTGAAPQVTFLLLRTEDADTETHQEELNWVNALEWADSVGVDIIHSSLGYSVFDTLEGNYTYFDMDGESTIITLATKIAIEKGIFVTNSAGNEGAREWKYITAPCDGKGVLCVGALDSFGVKAGFSSFGPSADGRVKPEVMAMGKNIYYISDDGTLKKGNGTSLSGPIIAGMVACLKQAWPTVPNDTIFSAIIRSADRYSTPDSAYGYGIPDVLIADSLLRKFVSVQNQEIPHAMVFPNPARYIVTVKAGIPIHLVQLVEIQTGRTVKEMPGSGNEIIMDLKEIARGMYILVIETGSGTITKRLAIQ